MIGRADNPDWLNKPFRDVYPGLGGPRALAVCVDWQTSMPDRLNLRGRAAFAFAGAASSCRPTTDQQARDCALKDCRQRSQCGGDETCVVADVDGRNALTPPGDWSQRHVRQ